MLSETITPELLKGLRLRLNKIQLPEVLGEPAELAIPLSCPLCTHTVILGASGSGPVARGYFVTGVGYVCLTCYAVLVIRGLVAHIDTLTDQVESLQKELTEAAPAPPPSKFLDKLIEERGRSVDAEAMLREIGMPIPSPGLAVMVDPPLPPRSTWTIPCNEISLGEPQPCVLGTEPEVVTVEPAGTIKKALELGGQFSIEPDMKAASIDAPIPIISVLDARPKLNLVRDPFAGEPKRAQMVPIVPGDEIPGLTWLRKPDGRFTGQVEIDPAYKVDILALPPGTMVQFKKKEGKEEDYRTMPDYDPSVLHERERELIRVAGDPEVGPAVIRKFGGQIEVRLPEVDLSSLEPEDRDVYEGYQSGTITFSNASDVYEYERRFGDPALMAALAAQDDAALGPEQRNYKNLHREAGAASATVRLPARQDAPEDGNRLTLDKS